jgi:hypothetical protein
MKCREVKYWLYSFRPNTSWPADLVGHLQGCQECQRLRSHLKQIDQEVFKLTTAPANARGKEQLLARIEHTPQQSVPTATPASLTPKAWKWTRLAGYLSGAAALVLIGWFFGRPGQPIETVQTVEVFKDKLVPVEVFRDKTVEVFRDKIKTVEVVRDKLVPTPADRELFASLMKHNAELVQATGVPDRLSSLLDMANDCRLHALTLLDRGPREYLPLTINMYGKLLREGVLVQLRRANEEARPELTETVRARLEQMSMPAEVAARPMPKVLENQRDALQSATRQALESMGQLDQVVPAKPVVYHRSEPVQPTTALILFAIAVSNETDQVARAEFCSECIQQLMPYVLLSLADTSSPQQTELGQQFGELIRFGIYTPIAQAKADNPAPPNPDKDERVLKAKQVMERTNQAVDIMQRNLQQADAAERANLERALDAIRRSVEKNKGKHKGNDKSSHPGKQKKASLDPARFHTYVIVNPVLQIHALPQIALHVRRECGNFYEPKTLERI